MKRIFILMALLWPLTVSSATSPPALAFTWTQPTMDMNGTPTTVAANKVSCGAAPRTYTIHHTTSVATTTVPISDVVTALGAYYCAAKAINTSGEESGYSNEIFLELLDPALLVPAAPSNFGVQ